MPNQYTRKNGNAHHKVEAINEFPASFKNVSPESGRKRAEFGAEIALSMSADQRKQIADWVLSNDQRRNVPPLSLFVDTRSKPVEFCALVLSAVLAAYPDGRPVGMKELNIAYAVMHRTALDTRCVRIAAWALGGKPLIRFADPISVKVAKQPNNAPETPVEVPAPVVEDPPNEVALLREEVKSLTEIVDTLSKQLEELTRASMILAKRQGTNPVPAEARGVTLAQLAEVGMEIRLIPVGGAK